jgi:hypothetical protein
LVWLLVVAAHCSARYLGWLGFILGAFIVSALIVLLDVRWIFQDMRQHPQNGRDADFLFWLEVLGRIVLLNGVLLPATITGLRLRARHRRVSHETKVT